MTTGAAWRVVTASARGSAHTADVPNQDRVAWAEVGAGPDAAVVAAVSDGHGGSRYVRSAIGAELAVGLAVDEVRERLGHEPGAGLEEIVRAAAPAVVAAWRQRVLGHATAHAFTADERVRARSDLAGDPLVSYGATLLLAVARGPEVAFAQLGDGDVLARVDSGTALQPVPGDDRLVGGETTSLCLPGAERDFRFATLDGGRSCDLVVLASDGYGNAFASGEWRERVVHDIAGLLASDGLQPLGEALPGWLEESAQVGGDDVTVAVLMRDRPHAMPDTRRGGPRPWAVAVGVAVLLAAALTALLLARRGESAVPPPPPVPTTSVHRPTTSTTPTSPSQVVAPGNRPSLGTHLPSPPPAPS